jgi:hypothetical protein
MSARADDANGLVRGIVVVSDGWRLGVAKVLEALPECFESQVVTGLEFSIFDFDTDGSLVADIAEGGQERVPIDAATAGQYGCVELDWSGEDADVVESVGVDCDILGVDVDQSVREFGQGGQVVHVLPDHVRGVVVESEVA